MKLCPFVLCPLIATKRDCLFAFLESKQISVMDKSVDPLRAYMDGKIKIEASLMDILKAKSVLSG